MDRNIQTITRRTRSQPFAPSSPSFETFLSAAGLTDEQIAWFRMLQFSERPYHFVSPRWTKQPVPSGYLAEAQSILVRVLRRAVTP